MKIASLLLLFVIGPVVAQQPKIQTTLTHSLSFTVALASTSDLSRAKCEPAEMSSLACASLEFTLTNVGNRTIHISSWTCPGYAIFFEERNRSGNWIRVASSVGAISDLPNCGRTYVQWQTVAPGEHLRFTSTMGQASHERLLFTAGSHQLRAMWSVSGCVDAPDGGDCSRLFAAFGEDELGRIAKVASNSSALNQR